VLKEIQALSTVATLLADSETQEPGNQSLNTKYFR
jgi:hypothetical protein